MTYGTKNRLGTQVVKIKRTKIFVSLEKYFHYSCFGPFFTRLGVVGQGTLKICLILEWLSDA